MQDHKPEYRYDIIQNSDEWYGIKVGTSGASSAPAILMDKNTVGYKTLKDRLVEERITGEVTESKVWSGNKFTERGHEFEPIARDDYQLRHFQVVDIIGVVVLDDFTICSPDGLIGVDKLHQVKCPIFNTQKKYLKIVAKNKGLSDNDILKKIDGGYYKQCQDELYITGRKINVWTSFHPHLPAIDLNIERDNELIKMISIRREELKQEVLSEIEEIKKISND